jgi:hypothetical protein
MKKITFYFLIFYIFSSNVSSQINKEDDNDVINIYLKTLVKDSNKEIIIIREKISNNETIDIFRGHIIKEADGSETRDSGVDSPLYQNKYWLIMKNKYSNDKTSSNKKNIWNITDFKHKKIEFMGYEECLNHFKNFDFPHESEKLIYSFSDSIYYKNKKYVTFTVKYSSTKFIGMESYIVIMTKIKGNWVLIKKISPYIFS